MNKVRKAKIGISNIMAILICILIIAISIGSLIGGKNSLASEFNADDLVLAVGDEVNDVIFSFDGEFANEIIISPNYEGVDISWEYSLDKGLNWNLGEGLRKKLTDEEISLVNSENDIVVRITDLINQEESEFIIDITEAKIPRDLYANDLENRLYGSIEDLEWSVLGDKWIPFSVELPNLEGNIVVQVRVPKKGTVLNSSIRSFVFTENANTEDREYLSNEKIVVSDVSSEDKVEGRLGENVIDGSGLTAWETKDDDEERYITLMFASPIYFKGIDLVPNEEALEGNMRNVNISVSMDGENWTLVKSVEDLENDSSKKTIDLDNSVLAGYVKIAVPDIYSTSSPVSLALINVFEDNTKRVTPNLKLSYDVVGLTNTSVVARLLGVDDNIKILSEGGNEHLFTENDTFVFIYENELGMCGETVATVDWIDKVAPTASIRYTTTSSGLVKATLVDESETIEIINNGGFRSYSFSKNGTFEFIYRDLAGNEGKTTATVDWIKAKPISNTHNNVNKPSDNSHVEDDKKDDDEKNDEGDKSDKSDEGQKDANTTDLKTANSFTINNVTLTILGDKIEKPIALKMDTKEINKGLKAKVGKGSVYYQLYFIDEDGNEEDLARNYKMILKLDSDKIFKGLFKVVDGSNIEKLEYTTRGANEIEVDIDTLGSYIISYDEDDVKVRKTSVFDYMFALVIAIFLAISALIVYRKTR